MGARFTSCCYYVKHDKEEKSAILRMSSSSTASRPPQLLSSESSDSEGEDESLFGPPQPSRRCQWSKTKPRGAADPGPPGDSPIRRGSDRELQAFIDMRDRADKATEEWEKLNYDIHTLRYARREVRSRWKKILLQLGYQCEVEALLSVNRQSCFTPDREHLHTATRLLEQLLNHTCLFPPETGRQNRYLCVMDRLVSLDSAEDFVTLAKEKYPKKVG